MSSAPVPVGCVAALSANGTTLTMALDGTLDTQAAGTVACLIDGAAASGAEVVEFDLAAACGCDERGRRLLERAAAVLSTRGPTVTIRARPRRRCICGRRSDPPHEPDGRRPDRSQAAP